jgi:hypothetical protein
MSARSKEKAKFYELTKQ